MSQSRKSSRKSTPSKRDEKKNSTKYQANSSEIQDMAYGQNFLHPKKQTAESFLKDISYQIDLDNLYELKRTSFYHSRMQYVAVVLQIQDKMLRTIFKGRYLLQVWKKGGQKVFQKILNSEIEHWVCYNDTLIYRTPEGNEFDDCITIIDLKDPMRKKIYVKDFSRHIPPVDSEEEEVFQFFFFCKDALWMGSNQRIIVSQIPKNKFNTKIEVNPEKVCIYDPRCKIWGFYPDMLDEFNNEFTVIFETFRDHILDFNKIKATSFDHKNFIPEVKQLRNVVPRKGYEKYKVREVSVMYSHEGTCFAMAILKDGYADFYWNMNRICSNGARNLVTDMAFNETHFFFHRKDENFYVSVSLSNKSQINFDYIEEQPVDITKKVVDFSNIKNHLNIFSDFVFMKNTCFVCHGNILSQFDIIQRKWTLHSTFADPIIMLFKIRDPQLGMIPAVLLKNGHIFCRLTVADTVQFSIEDKVLSRPDLKIPYEINKVYLDQEDSEKLYLLVKKDGEPTLLVFKDSKYKIVKGIKDLKYDANITVSFSDADNTQFLYKTLDTIYLYEQKGFRPEDEFCHVFEVHRVTCYEVAQILEINSAFSTNYNDKIALADHRNLYIWDVKRKKIKIIYDQFVRGLFFFDDTYAYTLTIPHKDRKGGLRLYEASGLLEGQSDSYLLQQASIGILGHIDFNRANCRLCYMKTAETLEIIPLLHRNTITFLGMPERNKIICTRTKNDRFSVLTTDKDIITWDVTTGKRLFSKRVDIDTDFYQIAQLSKNPTIYTSQHYEKVLLRHNNKLQHMDEAEFFKTWNKKSTVRHQLPFIESVEKDFYYFQLVKLESEKEVRILRRFRFPMYKTYQRLYFSEDNNLMIEQLEGRKVQLYEWFPEPGSSKNGTYQIVKRLHMYPYHLEPKTPFLTLNTPCFERYINFNDSIESFELIETRTQKQIAKIPRHALFMNGKETPELMMKRFKWLDSRFFKYITSGGIERIIDTQDNFKEVGYNVIQNIDTNDRTIRHFYDSFPPFGPEDVSTSLEIIQNKYKSAQFLEKKTQVRERKGTKFKPEIKGINGLYPIMFSVHKGNMLNNYTEKIIAVHSFTFLDWKIVQDIEAQRVQAEEIDIPQLTRLCQNIFPGGMTILHILADNPESLEKVLALSQPVPEDREEFQFEIPYHLDFKKKGMLDICFERSDLKTINIALDFFKGYGIDHHSRAIVHILPHLVELPNFVEYVDSRFQQTDVTCQIRRGALSEETQGLAISNLQMDKDLIRLKLFQRGNVIEQEVNVQVLDIPKMHDYQERLGDDFIKAVSHCSNFELYQSEAVQNLINIKYKLVRKYTMYRLFYPFLIFQVSFFLYTTFIKVAYLQDPTHYPLYFANYALQFILFILSLYFLQNQAQLIKRNGKKHFEDPWNWIDVINPQLVLMMLVNFYLDSNKLQVNDFEIIMSAISTFTMWAKQLYFLRVFDSYAYLIRMISICIMDMKEFLVMLALTLICFSDTFRSISDGNPDNTKFVKGSMDSFISAYKVALGDFGMEFGSVALWMCMLFFYLTTIFNLIVMFNLLIAIISETFTKVNENAEEAGFQEKANTIASNSYLVPEREKQAFCEDNQFPVRATYKDGNDSKKKKEKEIINNKIQEVKDQLKNGIEQVKDKIFEHDQLWDMIHDHLGLKKRKNEEEKMGKGAQNMMLGITKGLSLSSNLSIKSQKSITPKQKTIKGIDLGGLVEKDENEVVHNIDPMKILGAILKEGLRRKRELREQGIEEDESGGMFAIASNSARRQEEKPEELVSSKNYTTTATEPKN